MKPQPDSNIHGATQGQTAVAEPEPPDLIMAANRIALEAVPENPCSMSRDQVLQSARLLERHGLLILDQAVPAELIEDCRLKATETFDRCLARQRERDPSGFPTGTKQGYAEIVQRAPGRFDLIHGLDEGCFQNPLLTNRQPWRSLLEHLLGVGFSTIYRGLLMAQPAAGEHPWHADGEHLFPRETVHLPPHCINVFVPLVDIGPDNGPTEFCPGSHRQTLGLEDAFEQDKNLPERIGFRGQTWMPSLPAGSVLLFDYRLVHRARANHSGRQRPVLYFSHGRSWFRDVHNFPSRRLFAES